MLESDATGGRTALALSGLVWWMRRGGDGEGAAACLLLCFASSRRRPRLRPSVRVCHEKERKAREEEATDRPGAAWDWSTPGRTGAHGVGGSGGVR